MAEKAAISAALKANKEHQHALKDYIERLENELQTVDKMIEDVDTEDDAEVNQDDSLVCVEGAKKPLSIVLPRTLLSEDSPFFEDAQWKKRYDEFTTVNQLKAKEHDALREAVRSENMRMQTLEAQTRNQPIDLKAFPPEHFEQNTEGIDWRRVSVKVNSLLPRNSPRTPRECEIRWIGHLHPSINNGPWTPEETTHLKDILAEGGPDKCPRDWVGIVQRLGTNRTPIDCMRHGMTRRIHVWSPEVDKKLLEAVELYGQNNWQLVAMSVSKDATAHQCQKRYLDSLDPSIKSGPWTAEEDEQLRRAIAAFAGEAAFAEGASTSKKQSIPWQDIALFVPGRTNNQCREHYISMLKTKNKTTKSRTSRSAKGKGKSLDPTMADDEEKIDDYSDLSDLTEEEQRAQENKGEPRAKTRALARKKSEHKGKDRIGTPDRNNGRTPRNTELRDRPKRPQSEKVPHLGPKPKPRVRPRPRVQTHGSGSSAVTKESSREPSHRTESELQPEPGRDGTPSSVPARTPDNVDSGDAQSTPKVSLRNQNRRSSRRGITNMRVPNEHTGNAEDDRPSTGFEDHTQRIDDDQEKAPSSPEPVNKRRKIATRNRRAAEPRAVDARNQTSDNSGAIDGLTEVAASEHTGNEQLRRSSRLSKSGE
ncbi:hypothetical protein ACEPAG_6055 [Sanghuangporus baumii]